MFVIWVNFFGYIELELWYNVCVVVLKELGVYVVEKNVFILFENYV